jgi:Phage Tail Collar Domain
MPCSFTTTISGTECIGDSLVRINTNYSNLDTAACSLSAQMTDLKANLVAGNLKGPTGPSGDRFYAPVGTIAAFAGTNNTALLADKWVLCDGARKLVNDGNVDYTALAAALNTYDPTNSGYFFVPNLTNRLIVGKGIYNALGSLDTVTFAAGTANSLTYANLQYYIKY